MIKISPTIFINDEELYYEFVRATGPGGQNVNKVATAVQLRFDIANSPSLASDLKRRLLQLSGRRVNADGVLMIEARRFRTQEQNREDALKRFIELIQAAAIPQKQRKKTKPTAASQARRLKDKKVRGDIKRIRKAPIERE